MPDTPHACAHACLTRQCTSRLYVMRCQPVDVKLGKRVCADGKCSQCPAKRQQGTKLALQEDVGHRTCGCVAIDGDCEEVSAASNTARKLLHCCTTSAAKPGLSLNASASSRSVTSVGMTRLFIISCTHTPLRPLPARFAGTLTQGAGGAQACAHPHHRPACTSKHLCQAQR